MRHIRRIASVVALILAVAAAFVAAQEAGIGEGGAAAYSWPVEYDAAETIAARIAPPAGYERVAAAPGSFARWLRYLPVKKGAPPVMYYDGTEKPSQGGHVAVVDIDIGGRDLQQCADAVIRLRAEYLFSVGGFESIHFNFTSGHRAEWLKWAEGYRAVVAGSVVKWVKTARKDSSYGNFRNGYLNKVFQYAGTASLEKELSRVASVSDMRIGDVFIRGGHPGHAVIVVDMARNPANGKKVFLLAQSFMPAQSVHVIKNPNSNKTRPWYDVDLGDDLRTYNWTFGAGDLRRFR